jgi:DNA recombination protein RmuC
MPDPWLIAAALAGLVAGALLVLAVRPDRAAPLAAAEAARDAALARIGALEADAAREREARTTDRQQLEAQARELGALRSQAAALAQQLASQADDRAALTEKFRLLAAETLEPAVTKLAAASQERLDPLLAPLRERLVEFQKQVADTYQAEARERFSLKAEVAKALATADDLSRALKGQSQLRGTLGETMLERVLQAAGLQRGLHYVPQGAGLGLRDADGALQKPDVIVTLPDDRVLIIDSKLQLVDYAAWAAADPADEPTRAAALKGFLAALRGHVNELAGKGYQHNEKLLSPDLVLLYMPFEHALATAMQADPELFAQAWAKRVAIVAPNTLVATLRVVAGIWQIETNRANAQEIARVGTALYEKLAAAMDDVRKVGTALDAAQKAQAIAVARLWDGRGSVRAQARTLEGLGIKGKKSLPPAAGEPAADDGDADDDPPPPALPSPPA